MRCGRRDQQRLHRGADDGAAGREAVRGRAGRRRHHDRVGRVAHERAPRGFHRDGGGLLPGKPDERDVVERRDQLASDDGIDGQARFGGELVVLDRGQRVGQVGHVDLGQEPELAQVHAEDRGALHVGDPHGAQHRAVAAQAHQQIRPLPELGGGHRLGGAGQPADLGVDAENLDVPAVGPLQDRPDCPGAVPLGVQHYADDVHALKVLNDPAGRKRRLLPFGQQHAQAGHAAFELLELADVHDDRGVPEFGQQVRGRRCGRRDQHVRAAERDDMTAGLLRNCDGAGESGSERLC